MASQASWDQQQVNDEDNKRVASLVVEKYDIDDLTYEQIKEILGQSNTTPRVHTTCQKHEVSYKL